MEGRPVSVQPERFCTACGGGPLGVPGACPDCGATARTVRLGFSATVRQQPSVRYAAKKGGRGKPFVTGKAGAEFFRRDQRWHWVVRQINRARNWYSELITDQETNEIVRAIEEPLSDHQGRGSAKKRSD